MSILVFVGKGGTGKTTLTALTLKYFSEKNEVVLAFDLDPDSHLYKLIGFELNKTIGDIVDFVHKQKHFELEPIKPPELSDREYFSSLVLSNVLVEGDQIDLITLGKPSSKIDCYCPVFLWTSYTIKEILKSYGKPYKHVVVDCDPGTEIFPRKILKELSEKNEIDYLFAIVDTSSMSLDTAEEIKKEIKKIELKIKNFYCLGNKIPKNLHTTFKKEVEKRDMEIIGFIPEDSEIVKSEFLGKNLLDMPEASEAYQSMKKILGSLYL